jgi:hypothetical protein
MSFRSSLLIVFMRLSRRDWLLRHTFGKPRQLPMAPIIIMIASLQNFLTINVEKRKRKGHINKFFNFQNG